MSIKAAALKTNMCEMSAHKYLGSDQLPSEMKKPMAPRAYRTRPDAFAGVWDECVKYLARSPGLEAKALFEYLRKKYPKQFTSGQLRTFQRRVRAWRGMQDKEVYFEQTRAPGKEAQSDFTSMNSLKVTIQGRPFQHLLYHFVLPYSNWESVMVCASESFDALSAGLQKALGELNGVPSVHQTDSMSCAVRNHRGSGKGSFTERYQELVQHYGMTSRHTQVRCPHENGSVEQRHHRVKRNVENQLILRGSHDFASREDYEQFLESLIAQSNKSRHDRFAEELAVLNPLPAQMLDTCQRIHARVSRGSTIQVKKNRYSVPSCLIGKRVEVRIYAQRIEVWYAQVCQEQMQRLHGTGKHLISYRHVIRSLMRKPGAFAGYRYRADMFPTGRFRETYDALESIVGREDLFADLVPGGNRE